MKINKVFLITLAVVAPIVTVCGQTILTTAVRMPVLVPAENGVYSNYRTYENQLIINDPGYAKIEGGQGKIENIPVTLPNISIAESNADFKFIYQLNSVRVLSAVPANPSAPPRRVGDQFVTSSSDAPVTIEVVLDVVAYDKAGNPFWMSRRKDIAEENQTAQVQRTDVFVQNILIPNAISQIQLDAKMPSAIKEAVAKSMDEILNPFREKYFGLIKMDSYPFIFFATSFRGSKDLAAMNDAILKIDTIANETKNIDAWEKYVYSLEPMMDKYSTITGIRNEEQYRKADNYNLATIYILKGDTVKANEYLAKFAAIDPGGYQHKTALKWYDKIKEKKFEPKPVTTNQNIHTDNMEPFYTMDELLFRTYNLMFKGTAYLKTGETRKGIFMLANDRYTPGAPLILDLDQVKGKKELKPVLMLIYEKLGGNPVDTVSVARIDYIAEDGGGMVLIRDANRGKSEAFVFYKTIYHSTKIKIFRQLFPEPDFDFFYLLRDKDSDMYASGMVVTRKSLMKYFNDCKPMVEAIDKRLVSHNNLQNLGKYYTEQCD